MTDQIIPPPSGEHSDLEMRHAAHSELLATALKANKAALFEALAGTAITLVVVGFDGVGDSGQIEGIDAYIEEVATPLPSIEVQVATVAWNATEVEVQAMPLAAALEAVAYGLLEARHDGWEINEGAFGEFSFDLPKRSIRLDYNQRVETSELTVSEW